MFFSVDGGHSWISSSSTTPSHRQHFLALVVGAPDLQLWHLPGGLSSTFLSIDGGRSWVYNSDTSQGARHRRFLALLMGAPRSPASAPPRGPTVDALQLSGSHS
jgi:hypothetical protein